MSNSKNFSKVMSESMDSEMVSPRMENRDLLLKAVMEKLKISNEDMSKRGYVKEKLREINLDILLS
jgi:hypothetical protein